MNDRCNSSDTEVGVLTVITGYGQAPPKGGTYRHRWSVTHYFCNPRRSENLLTYLAASHLRTRGAYPSPVRRQDRRIISKTL
ncbi:hypothetical protein AVEN_232227-1 [Araneus ventricosus]|uniref:Uncharacterized protein n=1 Tax=Araneus ventricosus TaxID=182803 RepID=A0A4Y2MS59_ARAVE|nr:hypothetical protein AVEN_232227-1 [Araneus ventricosus]